MPDRYDKLRKKVTTLLTRASATRVKRAQAFSDLTEAREATRKALRRTYGDEGSRNLAFHLMDWTFDAAFLLALAMFPEKFSRREIEDGIDLLIVHVPNHVAAAAKISGYQCKDIWREKRAVETKTRKRPTAPRTLRRVRRRK